MSKPVWLVLVVFGGLMALWRVGVAGKQFFDYQKLDCRVATENVKWEVIKLSPSRWTLSATTQYVFEKKEYGAESLLGKPYFLNRFAAEEGIQKREKEPLLLWISSKDPQFASLEKIFPYREILYAFFSVVILGYFLFLKTYLAPSSSKA